MVGNWFSVDNLESRRLFFLFFPPSILFISHDPHFRRGSFDSNNFRSRPGIDNPIVEWVSRKLRALNGVPRHRRRLLMHCQQWISRKEISFPPSPFAMNSSCTDFDYFAPGYHDTFAGQPRFFNQIPRASRLSDLSMNNSLPRLVSRWHWTTYPALLFAGCLRVFGR